MLGHLGDGAGDHDGASPRLDGLLQLGYPHLSLHQLGLRLLPLRDSGLEAGLDAATHAAPILHPASLHQLLYQWLHVDVEPLGGSEVRVAAGFVEDNLTDALFNQLIVGGSHQGVVPDADQVLEDREEVGLALGVHHKVLHQLKTLIDVIQLETDVIKPTNDKLTLKGKCVDIQLYL